MTIFSIHPSCLEEKIESTIPPPIEALVTIYKKRSYPTGNQLLVHKSNRGYFIREEIEFSERQGPILKTAVLSKEDGSKYCCNEGSNEGQCFSFSLLLDLEILW